MNFFFHNIVCFCKRTVQLNFFFHHVAFFCKETFQ